MIVDKIKALCKERNITMVWLESHLHLGRGVIISWRKKSPSVNNLSRVADYFGVPLDYFVKEDANGTVDD